MQDLHRPIRPNRCARLACASAAASLVLSLGGCVERRVFIETDPPGALVWLNDAQVGRSPVDVGFTHHGVYDLRIEKEGYEPLVTPADTNGPVWDMPPLDFVFEVLPVTTRAEARWKFTLVPRDDSEEALVARASALRARAGGAPVKEGAQTGAEADVADDAAARTGEDGAPAADSGSPSEAVPGRPGASSPTTSP